MVLDLNSNSLIGTSSCGSDQRLLALWFLNRGWNFSDLVTEQVQIEKKNQEQKFQLFVQPIEEKKYTVLEDGSEYR